MKRLVKSVFLILITVALAGSATGAYFTSSVTAEDNTIKTGTLMAAVGTSQYTDTGLYNNDTNSNTAWRVAYDNHGTVVSGGSFPALTNMAPREERSIYVAIYNWSDLPFYAQGYLRGLWSAGSRLPNNPDSDLMQVRNVHRYAVTATGGCENHSGCRAIRQWLTNAGYTPANASKTDVGPFSHGFTTERVINGNDVQIGSREFVVYRIDVRLSPNAGNDYQGATYSYNFYVDAWQAVPTGVPRPTMQPTPTP